MDFIATFICGLTQKRKECALNKPKKQMKKTREKNRRHIKLRRDCNLQLNGHNKCESMRNLHMRHT